LKLGVAKTKVRKRWSRDHTHDLWVGDFEEGPYILVGKEILPTYLCAFIDCSSRYVIEARYYLRQNLDILIDSLLRALAKHGAPWSSTSTTPKSTIPTVSKPPATGSISGFATGRREILPRADSSNVCSGPSRTGLNPRCAPKTP